MSSAIPNPQLASGSLLAAVETRRNVHYAQPGSDDERYLRERGIAGVAGGDKHQSLTLPPKPLKIAVLEEFLHGTQDSLGIFDSLGQYGCEVHVRSFMLRHRRLLGLTEDDVDHLRILLSQAEADLATYT